MTICALIAGTEDFVAIVTFANLTSIVLVLSDAVLVLLLGMESETFGSSTSTGEASEYKYEQIHPEKDGIFEPTWRCPASLH